MRLLRRILGKDANVFIEFESSDYAAQRGDRRRPLGVGYIEHWLTKLSNAQIPAIVDEVMGCDGAVYIMEFIRGLNRASYTGWCAESRSHQILVDFGNELLRRAGVRGHELAVEGEE